MSENNEPIFSALDGKATLSLAIENIAQNSVRFGIKPISYGELPVGTTQLRITLEVTGGVSPLPSTMTNTVTSSPSTLTYTMYNSNYPIGIEPNYNGTVNTYVIAGHRDFSVTGTVTIEALDASNTALATGTVSGTLSYDDDD